MVAHQIYITCIEYRWINAASNAPMNISILQRVLKVCYATNEDGQALSSNNIGRPTKIKKYASPCISWVSGSKFNTFLPRDAIARYAVVVCLCDVCVYQTVTLR